MRREIWLTVALMLAPVGAMGPGALAAGTARVAMVDNDPDLTTWHFDPAQMTVPVGATVVWHNDGKQDHTVTADDKSFDSGYQKPGADWQRTFARPGNYAYHCTPHPWMTGVVRVAAALPGGIGATTTTAPSTTTSATTTSAMPVVTTPAPTASSAAPAGSRSRGRGLPAGVIAVAVLVGLGALAIGARLRRGRS